MASPELRVVVDMLRTVNPLAGDDVHAIRRTLAAAEAAPRPANVSFEPARVGGVAAEWTRAPEAQPERVVVYLHGGGYNLCGIATHRGLCAHLSRAAAARVLNVDYRLAPEHACPAAVQDAVAAFRGVLAGGVAPERVALAGDSAGGGLVLATLVALRDAGDPLPAAGVCLSPWTDLSLSGASLETRAGLDPLVQRDQLAWMAAHYLAGRDPRSPEASPLFADLAGLPPLLVHVGTAEILFDDAARLAERARAAGVAVDFEAWDDMIHVWHNFADMLPEAREAIARIGAFLAERIP